MSDLPKHPADPANEFRDKPMLFDPKAEWLLVHQASRPYGTEAVLEDTAEAGAASRDPAPAARSLPPGTLLLI